MGNYVTRQVQQKLQTGVVTPVRIFDDEEQRRSCRQASKELFEGLEEAALLLFEGENRAGSEIGEEGSEFREQFDEFRCGGTQGTGNIAWGTRREKGTKHIQQGSVG